jgi:AraC-like DNA-binding protein
MSNSKENRSKILYSCYFTRNREGEHFIPEHVFSYQIAGTLTMYDGSKTYTCKEGDFRLSRRNKLAKFVKQPPENGEFKSLSIFLDQPTLREISKEFQIEAGKQTLPADATLVLANHPLYKSFMDSLLIYLQLPDEEQVHLMELKIREAVLLLLKVNPEIKDVLFDFSEPGKIDLEAFMLQNFHFNVELQRFAYLTGRSLSTFKRDFEKIFHLTPSRWLIQKRLEEAYYLIHEKRKSPSDVYLEVGFEDLSHFSFAFKKKFGLAPSLIK